MSLGEEWSPRRGGFVIFVLVTRNDGLHLSRSMVPPEISLESEPRRWGVYAQANYRWLLDAV